VFPGHRAGLDVVRLRLTLFKKEPLHEQSTAREVEFPGKVPFNLITPTTVNRTQGLQVTEVLSENLGVEYLLASARPTGKE
jgi:hypothetical protein